MAALVENPSDWAWSSASQRYRMDQIPQGLKPPKRESEKEALKEKSRSLAALGMTIPGTAIRQGDSVDIDLRGEGG
jgi:hypothetical protein